MQTLPYARISLLGLVGVVVIIAANALMLLAMQSPARFTWLLDPDTAFFMRQVLHPPPWINWLQGDGFPTKDTGRLIGHGYLHGNWGHFAFNMVPFAALGWLTARRVGALGLIALYHLLMILAAAGYVLAMYLTLRGIIQAGNPFAAMAGASGAVHGLAGLWVIWALRDRAGKWTSATGLLHKLWPATLWLGFVFGVNIWTYIAMQGQFAWSLHVAGVMAGMAIAPLIPNLRPRSNDSPQTKNAAP